MSTDTETHDAESFDPIGTATLIGIYMAIVVLMWIFTYFIEFLGRGLTIVG
ncbi:cytochrome oxidase [Halorubellus litoreus]|uniref:Ba3-type terminal oxidase subunit CbaD n=1 Tax=Halorubellus litoreus TaxID=755308 RepID=A0ABD5VLT2_9EURY